MNQLLHLQRTHLASGAMGSMLRPPQIPAHPGSTGAAVDPSVASTELNQHDSYASGGTAADVASNNRASVAVSTEVGLQSQQQTAASAGSSLPPALQQYYLAMFGACPGMLPSMIVPSAGGIAGHWPSESSLQQRIQQLQGQGPSETLMRQLLSGGGVDSAARASRQPTGSNISTFLPQPLPVILYQPVDQEALSDYQCLVRKSIEVFTADTQDVEAGAQGRNRKVVVGQVGIRCIHCRLLHPGAKARGAAYYPSKLTGVYQAAQNMATGHLCKHCEMIPFQVRELLLAWKDSKSSAGTGKKYWAEGVRALGVVEHEEVLRFESDLSR